MLNSLESIMLSYGKPLRVLWVTWMDRTTDFDLFAFQVLICIVLSAGLGGPKPTMVRQWLVLHIQESH
jgi:hypothetical protein